MPLDVGERIGSYQILALLGKGGMGEVLPRPRHQAGSRLAIKVMPD